MAGIGFSLKKIFNQKGVLNLCRAYGYSSIVTIGPMIMGIALLVGISLLTQIVGMDVHSRKLLNSMLTYSLLFALFITTIFDMVVTRFVSDALYEGKRERVMPSFYGAVSLEIILCIATYGPFLYVSVSSVVQFVLCLWIAIILIIVWTEMIYMTALKDFMSITLAFSIALLFGFFLALVTVLWGRATLESLLSCVIVAYGLLAVRQYVLLLDYFPKSYGSSFLFLRNIDKYPELVMTSIMTRIGLYSHIIVMYFGPLRHQVQGLFYEAPEYDVPALIAFFSLLITTVSFVVSVEVNFFPRYSNYYGLFNNKGAIKDINLAEQEMLEVLDRELVYLGCKQIFTTAIFVIAVPKILGIIFPGLSSLSLSIYKFLCIGYGVYAVANSMMLIELYFEDYKGALIGSVLFSFTSTVLSIAQNLIGTTDSFGVAFFVGSIIFYFFTLIRLSWYTKRLPYYLLSRQSIVKTKENGYFVRLSQKMDELYLKLNKPQNLTNENVDGGVV